MPVDPRQILDLVYFISEDRNLRVTVKESLKGGAIAGVTTVVGGIIGGPIGLGIGGAIGGCTAAYVCRNKFKSAVTVIREMPLHKQQQLTNLVGNIVRNVDATDATTLIALVVGNPLMRAEVVDTVLGFLRNEMRMEVID